MSADLSDRRAVRESLRGAGGSRLATRAHALEEVFFAKREHELLDALRARIENEHTVEAIARACGIDDRETTEALAACGIRPETLPALMLVPLVEIAWADGHIEAFERGALVEEALAQHIERDSPAWELLQLWLGTRPPAGLYPAWAAYAGELLQTTAAPDRDRLARDLLEPARALVAHAARHRHFDVASRIDEERVLERIERLVARAVPGARAPADPAP